MEDNIIECDLVVVGAGMAGLTAASAAAQRGLTVMVVEAGEAVGGSAVLSGGYVWRLDNIDDYARIDPGGNRDLQAVILKEYEALLAHVAALGVVHSKRLPILQGHGHQIDIAGYFARAVRAVEAAGGQVVLNIRVGSILRDADGVAGVVVCDGSAEIEVRARAVLVATGGFAQSPELRAELLGEAARTMRARAGAHSDGGGLRLARAAGAGVVTAAGFYGHLIGADIDLSRPEVWDQTTLLHSRAGWLYDREGRRFVNETLGDNINAEALARESGMRGLLVWDNPTHNETVLVSWPPGNSAVDRFESALTLGAAGLIFDSLSQLEAFAMAHGFRPPTLPEDRLEGPYRALIVEPAITFPFAGITVDTQTRVLDEASTPIAGLFAAGVDCGGIYKEGYGGGLALAGSMGLRAARSAGELIAG